MAKICKELFIEALKEQGIFKKINQISKDSEGDSLTSMLDELFASLERKVKEVEEIGHTNSEAIIEKWRKKLIGDTEEAQRLSVTNEISDLVLRNKLDVEMGQYENPFEAVEAVLIGLVGSKKKGAAYSVDQVQKAILNTDLGRLINKLDDVEGAENLLKKLNSGKYDDNIIIEGFELMKAQRAKLGDVYKGKEEVNIGITKDIDAIRIAKILHDTFLDQDSTCNAAGAGIGQEVMGTFFRSNYNRNKILDKKTGGRTEFISYLKKEGVLDKEATFMGDAYPDEILAALFESIRDHTIIASHGSRMDLGSGHFANSRLERLKAFGHNSVAKKATKKTMPILVFVDAKAQIAFNKKFGGDSLFQNIMYDMESTARNTGLMKRMGTRPLETLKHLQRRAMTKAASKITELEVKAETVKLTKKEKLLLRKLKRGMTESTAIAQRRWYDVLDGSALRIEGGAPGEISIAAIGAWSRAMMTVTKLGSSTITAFSDIFYAGSALRAHSTSGAAESYFSGFANILRGRGNAEHREAVRSMGIGVDSLIGSIHAKFGSADSMPGAMTKLVGKFFTYNSMNWWNDSHRSGMIAMMSRNFGSHANTAFKDLPKNIKRTFITYDITEPEWNIYRKYGLNEHDGSKYMTNERFTRENIGQDDLVKYAYDKQLESKVVGKAFLDEDTVSVDEYQRIYKKLHDDPHATGNILGNSLFELKNKMNTMYVGLADSGVIMPGAYEKSLATYGGHAGTPLGEFSRFFMQFKNFPVSVFRKVAMREWRLGAGEGIQTPIGTTVQLYNAATLMAGTTLFGYLSLATKDVLMGRTPYLFDDGIWDSKTLNMVQRSFVQGGAGGLWADFVLGDWAKFRGSATKSALGPVLGQTDDLFTLMSNLIGGEWANAYDQTGNLILDNAAIGGNIWYIRYAVNYMFLNELQEYFNPGYIRRTESRIMRDKGQKYFLPPNIHE